MTAMTHVLPFGRPLVRADLEALPDDGHRYELLDGMLLVSPSPRFQHQMMLGNLYLLLRAAATPGLLVLGAPFAVALAEDTEVQPDLLVAPRTSFTDKELPGPPLLAVEVLSPSTRRVDLLLKRDRYQAAGVPSYWIVDPEKPSVTVLELDGEVYVEARRSAGASVITVASPFEVTFSAAQLLD
jgi:Uma2 family endonuclease